MPLLVAEVPMYFSPHSGQVISPVRLYAEFDAARREPGAPRTVRMCWTSSNSNSLMIAGCALGTMLSPNTLSPMYTRLASILPIVQPDHGLPDFVVTPRSFRLSASARVPILVSA